MHTKYLLMCFKWISIYKRRHINLKIYYLIWIFLLAVCMLLLLILHKKYFLAHGMDTSICNKVLQHTRDTTISSKCYVGLENHEQEYIVN